MSQLSDRTRPHLKSARGDTTATLAKRHKGQGPDGSIVIVGGGLAGLYTALKLAPRRVTVVAAAPLGDGASSAWAQGGIAAAVSDGDTAAAHAADTIAAGAGLVDAAIAQSVAEDAGARVRDLLGYGVPFDRDLEGRLVASKEAAHSAARVVRVTGDQAGRAIMAAIITAVRAADHIRVLEGYSAEQLTTNRNRITGVVLRDAETAQRFLLPARDVVLATGGIGALYAVTTNPAFATGDGIAMAAAVGATITDPEFVQFHPTALDVGIDPAPLASEALRGEGATLINDLGERFLLGRDPRGELASRDVVAQGVAEEIAAGRKVYLDCRTAIGKDLPAKFPTLFAHCQRAGLDPRSDLIPVAPAAHYHMGGVATDASGRTDVTGLWAIGEVAATGLHGANRLASNSLLEALVFGARAADAMRTSYLRGAINADLVALPSEGPAIDPLKAAQITATLRATMARAVGVARDATGLQAAKQQLVDLAHQACGDRGLLNKVSTAAFVVTGALARTTSIGAHWRSDAAEIGDGQARPAHTYLRQADIACVGVTPESMPDVAPSHLRRRTAVTA